LIKDGLETIHDYSEGDSRHASTYSSNRQSWNSNESNVKAASGLTKTNDVGEILNLAIAGKLSDARNKMMIN